MAADAAAALERHRLSGPPPHDLSDIYLIPDYITPVEEASLIRQIATSQQAWVQVRGGVAELARRCGCACMQRRMQRRMDAPCMRARMRARAHVCACLPREPPPCTRARRTLRLPDRPQLSGRRLQNHGGAVHAKGFLLPAPMPAWLSALTPRVAGDVPPLAEAGGPNHVLVNAYRPGEGIMVRGRRRRFGTSAQA